MNTITKKILNYSAYAFEVTQFYCSKLSNDKIPLVIFTQDSYIATRLQTEIKWLKNSLEVTIIPDWETLPYD